MLTKGDDFPIHQLPEPLAFAGSDRNFYDRYFFNGYRRDGEVYFSWALGLYPHLNIIDAALSLAIDGKQHNINASRLLNCERMDLAIGPMALEVIEPLQKLRLTVKDNQHNLSGEVVFSGLHPAFLEERLTQRIGPRVLIDSTRFIQNGVYEGQLKLKGQTINIKPATLHDDGFFGTRDRSWGVRPVGNTDSQPVAPFLPPQYFYFWGPANFGDMSLGIMIVETENGSPITTSAMIFDFDRQAQIPLEFIKYDLTFKPGTRHISHAQLLLRHDGNDILVDYQPVQQTYLWAIGYINEERGHGMYRGDDVLAYDEFVMAEQDETLLKRLQVQTVCHVTLRGWKNADKKGVGVFEHLFLGAHQPSGFKDFLET